MRVIDEKLLGALSGEAAGSPRARAHHNFHPVLSDPVQRMCVLMERGAYVRPHRHVSPPKWEIFLVLRGCAAVLLFDDDGVVKERVELNGRGGSLGAEIPETAWHTVVCLEGGTVLFEIKPGPYSPLEDKDFAPWAPAEGGEGEQAILRRLEGALPGTECSSLA